MENVRGERGKRYPIAEKGKRTTYMIGKKIKIQQPSRIIFLKWAFYSKFFFVNKKAKLQPDEPKNSGFPYRPKSLIMKGTNILKH